MQLWFLYYFKRIKFSNNNLFLPVNDLRRTNSVRNLNCCIHKLPIITPIQGHPMVPEVLKERRQDVVLDVLCLHTVSGAALLHNLQHNLLHLLVRRLELSDQDQHDLTSVVVGVLSVHEGDKVADSLKHSKHMIIFGCSKWLLRGNMRQKYEALSDWLQLLNFHKYYFCKK